MIKKNIPYVLHAITDAEYESALLEKLSEKVLEFQEGGDPEELADVIEVIESLCRLEKYKDVETTRIQKREEKGGFDNRTMIEGDK